MKKEFSKLLSTMLAMCFIFFILAGVLPATPVYAAVGDEFVVSTGFEADGITPVTIGADMKFKVTAEPSGGTPGTVQVGDDAVASILTTTNVAVTIPTLVSDGTNTYTVTSLGVRAFADCATLPSVVVPNSVGVIEPYAFRGCSALSSVNIPDGVTTIGPATFHSCSALSTITLPDSVTSIGSYAFFSTGLTAIDLNNVTTLETGVFQLCEKLTSIAIPEGVTDIPKITFEGCRELKSVTLPSTLKTIGDSAFSGDYYVSSLTLPKGLTTIGVSTFAQWTGLTSLVIPSSVTSIGDYAFASSDGVYTTSAAGPEIRVGPGLSSVSILSSDITMGNALNNCDKLTSVYFNGNYDAAKLGAAIASIPSDSSPTIYYNAAMAGWPAQLTIDGSATAPAVPVAVTHGTTQFTYDGSPKTVDVTDVLIGGVAPSGAYTVAGNTATAVGTHEFTVTIPVSGTDSIVYSGSYVISSPAPTPTPTPTSTVIDPNAISPQTGVYN